MTVVEALLSVPVIGENGLTSAEAEERLKQVGRNELAGSRPRLWRIFLRQFRSSFGLLLMAAGLVAYLLGERLDGAVIYGFVVLNAVISFFQEYRSEQMVALLKTFMKPSAKVRRGGKILTIDRTQVVPGDIVVLTAGDMLPADLRFTRLASAAFDESVLTGESVTVTKTIEAESAQVSEPYRARNIGFFGTVIVSGQAEGVAVATGKQSVIGDVAALSSAVKRESGFAKEVNRFSGFVLKVILLTLLGLVVLHLVVGVDGGVGELLVFAVALAVSVVPEALPVVTTFSLSHGALRLARKKVVVKRLTSIEDLGGVEVLCTDKTGTITENRLQVKDVLGLREETVYAAALCARRAGDGAARSTDAFDDAVWGALGAAFVSQALETSVLAEMPFDPDRRRNSVVVQEHDGMSLLVRGAPEAILAASTLPDAERQEVQRWLTLQGQTGARTLAVGKKMLSRAEYQSADEEQGLTWIGVVAFVDPIKPSTKNAIADARRLGLQVNIITGDSREVAVAVGREIGLIEDGREALSGSEFAEMSEVEKQQAVQSTRIFARVSPRQKYEIIRLLQAGKRVGYLGEGINDAPALKAADVGLVVKSASDIAREAADIVLLERDLQVVVDGIMEGRIVFANTLKYIKTTLASNFGHFYAIAIASLFIDFLPLLPLQILLINLLTDVPMIAIATDATDPQEVLKPERYKLRDLAIFTTGIGLVSTVFDLVYFFTFLPMGQEVLQTAWFIGSIVSEVIILYSLRSRLPFYRASRPSIVMMSLTVICLGLGLGLPLFAPLSALFKFIPLAPVLVGLVVAVALADFVATEISKLVYYRFSSPARPRDL